MSAIIATVNTISPLNNKPFAHTFVYDDVAHAEVAGQDDTANYHLAQIGRPDLIGKFGKGGVGFAPFSSLKNHLLNGFNGITQVWVNGQEYTLFQVGSESFNLLKQFPGSPARPVLMGSIDSVINRLLNA